MVVDDQDALSAFGHPADYLPLVAEIDQNGVPSGDIRRGFLMDAGMKFDFPAVTGFTEDGCCHKTVRAIAVVDEACALHSRL